MKLNMLFADGAVLQAQKPLRVFGEGKGKLCLSVNGNGFEGEMTDDAWCVTLPALPYGGPYTISARLDGEEKTLTDIWAGDVYLLAGQSNMQFKLSESDTPATEWRGDARIRLFSSRRPEEGEAFTPEDGWVALTAENAGDWSCIGYHMGQFLRRHTDRALGFVTCYQGAADIQSFLPDEAFLEHPEFDLPDDERFDMYYTWNEGHSVLWRDMVTPLLPLALAGVVWYQGESNCAPKEAPLYGKMLSCLIDSWRRAFEDDRLPFVIIQIADYIPRLGEAWTAIQRAQAEAGKIHSRVACVKSADVCERDLIHPTRKTELSKRVAERMEELAGNGAGLSL